MSFSMRWEAFKARHAKANPSPQAAEPPHMLRQHFAVSSRKVESEGASFEVYSVAPMKFNGSDALAELAPAQAAKQAVLYVISGGFVAPITKQSWDFVAVLASAGLRVDVPLYGLAPEFTVEHALPLIRQSYAQLVAEHGAENVTVIGDSAGGGLAVSALTDGQVPSPHALILNAPWVDIAVDSEQLQRQAALWSQLGGTTLSEENPLVSPLYLSIEKFRNSFHGSTVDVWCGTADPFLDDARAFAEKFGARLHEIPDAIHLLHLTSTPEAKAAVREMIHITGAR